MAQTAETGAQRPHIPQNVDRRTVVKGIAALFTLLAAGGGGAVVKAWWDAATESEPVGIVEPSGDTEQQLLTATARPTQRPDASATPQPTSTVTSTRPAEVGQVPTEIAPEFYHGRAERTADFTLIQKSDLPAIINSLRASESAFPETAANIEARLIYDGTALSILGNPRREAQSVGISSPVASLKYRDSQDGDIYLYVCKVHNADDTNGFVTIYVGGASSESQWETQRPDHNIPLFANVLSLDVYASNFDGIPANTFTRRLIDSQSNYTSLMGQFAQSSIVPSQLESMIMPLQSVISP